MASQSIEKSIIDQIDKIELVDEIEEFKNCLITSDNDGSDNDGSDNDGSDSDGSDSDGSSDSDDVEIILEANDREKKNIQVNEQVNKQVPAPITLEPITQATEPITQNEERTVAFNKISNKNETAKALLRTKECRNVVVNCIPGSGIYGVCTREHCTFAHSLDEYSSPKCSFDLSCRFRWPNQTKNCRFKHSDETEEWYRTRSKVPYPNLPSTSENTRKSKPYKKAGVHIPVKAPTKTLSPTTFKKSPLEKRPVSQKSRRSSDSDSEDDHRSKRLSQRSNRHKNKKSPDDEVTITVPKEMAEMALKAAFERGHLNVKLITI